MWMALWVFILDHLPLPVLRRVPVAWRRTPVPNLPPIVYTDDAGVGWTRMPDWQESWSEDIGQHDIWKRDLRLSYLRWKRKEYAMGGVDLRDYGLSLSIRRMPVPVLFPLHNQLADACRRLGFMQLFASANPDASPEEATLMWEEQEEAARVEAKRRYEARLVLKSTWNEVTHGPCEVTPQEDILHLLSVGPFEGAPLPTDPLTQAPRRRAPLLPLQPMAPAATPERFTRTK